MMSLDVYEVVHIVMFDKYYRRHIYYSERGPTCLKYTLASQLYQRNYYTLSIQNAYVFLGYIPSWFNLIESP